jgi:hypothetical protein
MNNDEQSSFVLHNNCTITAMSMSDDLIKKLSRKFEPSTTTQFRYRSHDVVVQTNDEGEAIRAFVGRADDEGIVKGERFSRVLKKDSEGKIIKDHWDKKGRAS